MAFYNELLEKTSESKQYFLSAPIITEVFEGNFSLETYVAFLNQAFHHVKHTCPLLMQAGARMTGQQEWARKAVSEYIDEEFGHEHWILNDIEACGYDRAEFESAKAPFTSDIMVSYLYDYVTRKNPMGIFGMVLVLEGTSSDLAPAVGSIVQEKLQLKDEAMTYLTTHGVLDQDHIQFFENLMNQISNEEDQAAIIEVANSVYQLYGDVYRSISQAASELIQQAA